MAVLLSPVFNIPAFTDANGNPLAGGRIYQYEAGSSSVLKTTYTTNVGDVANANPIVLNSAGQLPAGINIWLTTGEAYNLVLTQSDGTTVLKGFDNITGAITSSGTTTVSSIWVNTGAATYVSPTSFLVSGNVTAEYAIGNRARITTGSGYKYGTVTGLSFSSPNTTVTLVLDGGTLDVSVSAADYSQLIGGGRTVDAGGVSYFSTITYSTANTVGNKLQGLDTDIATTNTRIDGIRRVWDATLSGAAYTITPAPASTSYTIDQVFTVKFTTGVVGACTINVNGLGAKSLKVYDYSGTKIDPTILVNTLSDVAYDGTDFVILDQLPASPAITVHGMQVFTSNGSFVAPATTLKVTCVGGGGGGGPGYTDDADRYGGSGGDAAQSITYVTTTVGAVLAVSIGAGGTGGPYTGSTGTSATAGGSTTVGGTLATAAGGSPGSNAYYLTNGTDGAPGATGTGFVLTGYPLGIQYGNGGAPGYGGGVPGSNGNPGVVIIEW